MEVRPTLNPFRIRRDLLAWSVVSALSLFSAGTAWTGQPDLAVAEAATDPFPMPEALRPNVEFWTRVFSEWGPRQVVIHDIARPGIVYQIAELPGQVVEGYSPEQRAFVDRLRGQWAGYLHVLEQKVATGQPLDEIDTQWSRYIASAGDAGALTGAEGRVRSQRGMRESFRAGLERSARYEKRFREAFREAGLPEDLAYIPHIESAFQEQARSSAGAIGLWQFTKPAAKRYMTVGSGVDERFDPIAAARGAARYLRDAYDKLGAWPLAITSYNHGVEGMCAAKERFGTDFDQIYRAYDGKYFGFASKNFYAEFLAAREIASHAERYFPEGYSPAPEHDHDQTVLDRRMPATAVAKRYGVSVGELLSINPAWSARSVKAGTALPEGLRVWLPHGTLERVAAGRASGSKPSASRGSGGSSGSASSRRHVVRAGDTLMRIATTYGVKLAELLQANTLSHGSVIRPGQILHIPTNQ
jgi:membrane-bound lytic murein transglycosylase D